MTTADPYADLGVSPDATPAEIKSAYRKAAKRTHPDAGGDPQEFAKVAGAYLVLSDPERRKRYDETGEADAGPDNTAPRLAQKFAMMFMGVMEKHPRIETVDIIALMRGVAAKAKARKTAEREQLKPSADRIKAVMKRVQFKGKGPDLLTGTLNQQLQQITAAMADAQREIDDHALLLIMLEDYGWQFDEPEPPPMDSFTRMQGSWLDEEERDARVRGLKFQPPRPFYDPSRDRPDK